MKETLGKVNTDLLSEMKCNLEKCLESFTNNNKGSNKDNEGLFYVVEVENKNFIENPPAFPYILLSTYMLCFFCIVFIFSELGSNPMLFLNSSQFYYSFNFLRVWLGYFFASKYYKFYWFFILSRNSMTNLYQHLKIFVPKKQFL